MPTDKPSKLHLWTDENGTRLETCELKYSNTRNTQYIYITSDEEIKKGDWVGYPTLKNWVPVKYLGGDLTGGEKKIILTTDQDLIKDGVQAIDDEFLEWFVKNPSCNRVEVLEDYFKPSNMVYGINMEPYKIIIPSIGINSLNKQDDENKNGS